MVRQRRADVRRLVPRRPAVRGRAGAALDDADRRRARPRSSPTPERPRSSHRPSTPTGSPPIARRAPTVRAAVVAGEPPSDAGTATYEWSEFSDASEAPVAPTEPDSAGVLAVQLGDHRRAEGGHAPPRSTCRRRPTRTAARSSACSPDDRFLSVAKLFFAFGLGNSLTFPFSVGGTAILDPARPTPPGIARPRPDASSRRCSSPARASSPRCSTPTPRPTRSRPCAATVTAGESLPGRPPAPVRRALRPSACSTASDRPRRCTSSCPTRSPTSARGRAGVPVPGYAAKLLDDDGAEVTAPDTPGYLHVQRAVDRHRVLATGGGDRRRVRRRLAAHRRRLRALGRRLLDVPRPQQRHDQGRRDVGVAGGGGGRARRAPRRARGGGRRRPQRRRARGDRRLRRAPLRSDDRPRRASTPTAAGGWPRSSGRGG